MANFKFPSMAIARPLSLALAAPVLAGAVVQTWRDRGRRPAGATGLTSAAVLVPLILALGVSLARSPIYVVARYDLISWGAYYLLAGAVLSRLRLALAAPTVVLWVGLSVATLVPNYTTARARLAGGLLTLLAQRVDVELQGAACTCDGLPSRSTVDVAARHLGNGRYVTPALFAVDGHDVPELHDDEDGTAGEEKQR